MRISTLFTFSFALFLGANAAETTFDRFPSPISPINTPELNIGDMSPARQASSFQNPTRTTATGSLNIWDMSTAGCGNRINAMRVPAGERFVKMDSVVRTRPSGMEVSRQLMTYTDFGAPLRSDNYLPNDEGKWELYSYFAYDFDDFGRMILKETISDHAPSSNTRYEYYYDDDSDLANVIIFSLYSMASDDMAPYQKAEYVYDERGNCTETSYYTWSDDANGWIPAQRETATYDELNRYTSYMMYLWDSATEGWVGNNSTTVKNEGIEYNGDGEYSIVREYMWEDGKWLEYYNRIYTYDENGNLIRYDRKYWNREKQNWDGGETYLSKKAKYNSYLIYENDDKGRTTAEDAYIYNKNGEAKWSQSYKYTYTDNEDGSYMITEQYYTPWESATPSLYSESETSYDSNKLKVHDINYIYWVNGEKLKNSEIFYYNTEDGYYIGKESYTFNRTSENERLCSSKEWFDYSADWDHSAETPIVGNHWIGNGHDDTTWVPTSRDEFEWENNVLVMSTAYKADKNENFKRYYHFKTEFDFSIPMSRVWMWPIANKRDAFYLNKVNMTSTYQDFDGDEEWDENASYIDTFHYSEVVSTGVETTESFASKTEVARYNAAGIRVDAPVNGINIIKYSDGSSKKVIIR